MSLEFKDMQNRKISIDDMENNIRNVNLEIKARDKEMENLR